MTRRLTPYSLGILAIVLLAAVPAASQTPACVPQTGEQLIIYRAGSLTPAFKPLVESFTCRTGIAVKDVAMGSVDAARQITAGAQPCDLYAPADDTDIDLFLKPAGFAAFTISFARGKMLLMYSARGTAAKQLPPIAQPGQATDAQGVPQAVRNWYELLARPGVTIGAGHPFLDPGAYRANMIFQLAEAYYHVPNLYNTLLGHLAILPSHGKVGEAFDYQLIYEHSARAAAAADPDLRYVDLPEEINLSDPGKDAFYRENALVVLPGLGVPSGARTVSVPATHVAWGITVMKDAPHKDNAVRFLEMLLGPIGRAALTEHGPAPIIPARVSAEDFARLPASLRDLVKAVPR